MKVSQTWTIRGKTYNHEQLMELKRQGLDPRKDDIQMKFVTPQVIESERQAKETIEQKEPKVVTTTPSTNVTVEVVEGQPESEEQEFTRLKKERAWKNENKKARYNELKEKFKK